MFTPVFVLLPLAAVAAPVALQPGLYEVATTQDGAAPVIDRHCVTADEAAKGFELPKEQGSCKLVRDTFAGGKIAIAAECTDPAGPGSGHVGTSLTGSYTSTSYVVDMRMQGTLGGQPVGLLNHMTGKRIGAACKPEGK